jgi:soluble lytic murein transglycosylase
MDYDSAMRLEESLWQAGERTPDRALRLARLHLVHVRDDARKAMEYLDIAEKGGVIDRPDALFFRGRSHAKLEEYDASARFYRQYLDENPKGDKRPEALYYLAWLPYDHDEYEKALPEMDRFLAEVKQHELRSYVLWAKGWSLYRLKRFPEAIEVFQTMTKLGNCLVAGKGMYWAGMAHRLQGDEEQANRWMHRVVATYPLTWYAVLGAKRLHEWKGTPLPAWMVGPSPGLPEPKPMWPAKGLAPALVNRLRQVKDLSDVGETDRARALYQPMALKVEKAVVEKDLHAFLATIYDATEDYNASYQRGTKDFAKAVDGIPAKDTAAMWRVAYPRAHRSLIRVLGRRFDLPELWAYAIMRQESRYSPRQVSHTAALGIMQMIPKTAKLVGKVLGVPFEVETFFEPGRNLLFCTWYLSALLKDFKGQIVFASAAYNGGAPAIKRFLAAHRGLPPDEMVEEIPYNESRNYCRKVAEHLIRYAYLHLPAAKRKALYTRIFPDKVDYDIGNAVEY